MGQAVLLHTVAGLAPVFDALASKHLPGWKVSHLVDESLLKNTIRDGHLTKATMRRVAGHVWSAIDSGAGAILVTCSSIGAAVDATRPFVDLPLVRVDEGMADHASEIGERIGVIATLTTTLEPTRELVERLARQKGRAVRIVARVCDGAFERLSAGDRAGHDQRVGQGIAALAAEVDVLVLAQASMARVLEGDSRLRVGVPVLSSPESGILRFKKYLDGAALAA